ncbi:hypothetical protein AMTR_s00199p00034510 [Amborella trichopoda]|uniref:Uncharacterized protein n=1 Tax=Amborella trichopoda TaxID=13333 RepID=U5DBD0_AMBTC|nr:hypothetical protein AMTR_s00199p00034510 [Amborella trichopoda]
MIRPGIDEIHQSNTAIELGKEHIGVLRLRILNPLKTWPYTAVLTATLLKHPTTISTHSHGDHSS